MTIISFKLKFLKSNKKNIPNKFLIFKWINEILKIKEKKFYVNLLIINKKNIKYYNNLYKKNNSHTNVLTFISPNININKKYIIYCDILICKKIIEEESKNYKKDLYFHWAHIIIHSSLHIIGYDHKKLSEFKIMKKKEVEILSKFNFKNPYK